MRLDPKKNTNRSLILGQSPKFQRGRFLSFAQVGESGDNDEPANTDHKTSSSDTDRVVCEHV